MLRIHLDSECEEACEALTWLSGLLDLDRHLEGLESLPCQPWAGATVVVVDRFVTVYWNARKEQCCWRESVRFVSFRIAESKTDCCGQLVLATLLENVGLESPLCSVS